MATITTEKKIVPAFTKQFSELKDSASTLATFEPWERLFVDRSFNIRDDDESNYSPEAVEQLRANINAMGQQVAMIVSLQTQPKEDGADLLVCRGNRRWYLMWLDRQEDQVLIDQGKLDPMDRRWQYVKCEVRTGLTREQEEILMLDHDQEKELSAYEMYKAVKRLTDRGFNETEVKNTLGFNRGEITNHFKATQLPQDVQDLYVKYLKRKESGEKVFKMDGNAIRDLYKAKNADAKDPVTGKKVKKVQVGGGPEFKKKLEEIKKNNAPGNNTKTESTETRVKKIGTWLEDPNRSHPMFVSLINYFLKVEDKVNLSHLHDNIVLALHQAFPQPVVEETENEGIMQYEEGISKDLGTIPTETVDTETVDTETVDTETENAVTENAESENAESENAESENAESETNGEVTEPSVTEPSVTEEIEIDSKGRPRKRAR